MLVLIVLLVSVCIQFVSVYFALRLIKEIGGRLAWAALSVAIFLMAIRRSISLYRALQSYPDVTQDFYAEVVALIISICILVGVLAIGPLIKRLLSSEHELTEQMRRNQIFINTTPDAFMLTDTNGKIHEANHAFLKLFKFPDIDLLNSFSELLSPSQHKEFSAAWKTILAEKQNRFVFQYNTDNAVVSLELNAKLIEIDGERLIYAFIQDTTEREHMEARLFRQKERAQVILESIADGVMTTDKQGIIHFANSAAKDILGSKGTEILGIKLKNILYANSEQFYLKNQLLHSLVLDCIKQQKTLSFNNQIIIDSKDNQHFFDVIISPLKNRAQLTTGAVLVLRDVTELRQVQQELSYQTTHDPVTKLINRSGFEEKLEALFTDINKSNIQHAVLNISLDSTQLQLITDSGGQDAKDELLKQSSVILENIVGEKDCVTCVDHSDFLLVIENITVFKARKFAKKVIAAFLEEGFNWQSASSGLNACIGIAMLTRKTRKMADVLSYSLSACYVAKQNGKNQLHVYSEKDEDSANHNKQKMRLQRLQGAIDEERFKLFKQPICDLQNNGKESHCEILIRMISEEGEIIAPVKFLPVAEQYHLMPIIDRWVVKETFFLVKNSNLDSNAHCSINLSGQTIGDESFLDEVLVLFAETKIPFAKICFEITETAVISNFNTAQKFITTLRERGCKFSLDDFGSGLSSFGYLKDLPVDYLKIDGSFILGILNDKRDYNLVKSIHQIAKSMGIKTVAEFIESNEMAECVKKMGINYGQGYALGKPKPIDETS